MKAKFLMPFVAMVIVGFIAFFGHAYAPEGSIDVNALSFALQVALAVSAAASIWYFLTSLKDFKTSTKVAYYTIAAGIFFFALTQVEQLLVAFLSIDDDLILALLVLVPYSLSTLTMYLGARKLGRLLGLHSVWTSLWFASGLSVLAGCTLSAIPGFLYIDPESKSSAIVLFGLIGTTVGFSGAAAVVANRIKNTISSTYKNAMGWLGLALAILTFATIHEIATKATSLVLTSYVQDSYSFWPFVLACILFMRAAFAFRQAGVKAEELSENATYLDAVVYAAQLVSNPRAIDPVLNRLRQLTASLSQTNELSGRDKAKLVTIYQEIEDYLVTREPLRKIAKASLRARLTTEFQSELSKQEQGAAP